jgi:hypothetical protein
MEELQALQTAARDSGFAEVEESKDGTVLWFRKSVPDPSNGTHQRLCLDSMTKSATVFWTNARGQTDSRTFRSVTTLREWISGIAASAG